MTEDRDKRLRELLPKKKEIAALGFSDESYKPHEKELRKYVRKMNKENSIYNQAIDDCLTALKDKVVLKEELLSVKEIMSIVVKNSVGTYTGRDIIDEVKLAQALHNQQERKIG